MTNENTTYTISIQVPHYKQMSVERPKGLTDKEVFASLSYDDIYDGEDTFIETSDFFNAGDYTLSFCEEEAN